MSKLAARHNPFGSADSFNILEFAKDTEAANEITVTVTAKDANGQAIGERVAMDFYLSDDAEGDGLSATAATALAAGAIGTYVPGVTGKSGKLITNGSGVVELSITYTGGAKTWYVICVMPDGSLQSTSVVFV